MNCISLLIPDISDSCVVRFQEHFETGRPVDPLKANDGTRWNSERARNKDFVIFRSNLEMLTIWLRVDLSLFQSQLQSQLQFNAIQVDARQE